jgi:hypothetical protein
MVHGKRWSSANGVEPRAIYKGKIALSFRLQADGTTLETALHIGGYILGEERGATARS